MLRELSVQNLALIEDARVELPPGFCAWTGETGAGKSLLLAALGLVLGGKASAELVRDGRDEARAAAAFDLADPALRARVEAALGGPVDDDLLVLTRRITAQGRGSAHANGLPVPLTTLRALGAILVDIHGQHEGRALLDPDRQRAWLDDHGGLGPLTETYRRARAEHAGLRGRRLELLRAAETRAAERERLGFERDELAAADPRAGEYDDLSSQAQRLAASARVREAAEEAYQVLYEADRSAQGLLELAARRLEALGEVAPELADAAGELERLADSAREVAYGLRALARDRDDDPGRLDEIEARLALYRRLAARFRCGPDDLESRRAEVEARLAAIGRDEADLAELDAPLAAAWRALVAAAGALTAARRETARGFAREVQARLKHLGLPQARLEVAVEPEDPGDDPSAASPPESGADRVEILFAPNPGEPTRPLRKIASGGELSRVTLAIKAVLAGADGVPTLVFDEVDTGVGGRLGSALGKTLAAVARHHQVICVTHLPQLASYAAHQWVIRKETARGRTRTTIVPLAEADRVHELAAMLRGDAAAETTRQEALAMLAEARSAS